MRTWKSLSKEERRMLIIVGVLLIAILLSFGRIKRQFSKGMDFFFPTTEQTTPTDSLK